jgi:hypothetical protein
MTGHSLVFNGDAKAAENAFGYQLIPKGEYQFVIVEAETRSNKTGTGSYLYLQFAGVDSAIEGRKLFERLTVEHENIDAVEIGHKKITAIALAACGTAKLDSWTKLVGQKVLLLIGKKFDKFKDAEINVINGVKSCGSHKVVASPPSSNQLPPPAASVDDIPF